MIKIFPLLLVLLFFGYGSYVSGQNIVASDKDSLITQEYKHTNDVEEPPICENLTVVECLEIIIPALWDREVERDCE